MISVSFTSYLLWRLPWPASNVREDQSNSSRIQCHSLGDNLSSTAVACDSKDFLSKKMILSHVRRRHNEGILILLCQKQTSALVKICHDTSGSWRFNNTKLPDWKVQECNSQILGGITLHLFSFFFSFWFVDLYL